MRLSSSSSRPKRRPGRGTASAVVATTLFTCALTSGLALGQAVDTASLPQPLPQNRAASQLPAAPADRPGFERWIVHLRDSNCGRERIRAEMLGERDPARFQAILADIRAKLRVERANFIHDIESLGGKVVRQWWVLDAVLIEIEPKHLANIARLGQVRTLERDRLAPPAIKTAKNAANHDTVGFYGLTNGAITGAKLGVAILDSGFDVPSSGRPHITFSRRGSANAHRIVRAIKVGTASFNMSHPHGTAVASIAAGWNWNTATADKGHAYDAELALYSIANNSRGDSSFSNMVTAFDDIASNALRLKLRASNLSYGGSPDPASAVAVTMDAVTVLTDIVNATAAGNKTNNVSSSLCNLNGVSVAAVENNTHKLWWLSSRGTQGGRYFPNLAANGVNTRQAAYGNELADYVSSGTSMASPQVCGAAALLREMNPALSADETIAILHASTEKSPGAGDTIEVNGPGSGYMKVLAAGQIARADAQHGRAVVSTTSTTFSRPIAVRRGQRVQCAIKWLRDPWLQRASGWANLDLSLHRGTTTLVRSDSLKNLEEMLRYDADRDETLTMVVRLVTPGTGQTKQEFAWACNRPAVAADGPDLTPITLQGPTTLRRSSTVTLTAEVANLGNRYAAQSLTRYFLSTDDTLGGGDSLLGTWQMPGLNALRKRSEQRAISIPATARLGTCYILVVADAAATIAEANELNNVRALQVTCQDASPLPDLAIESVTAPVTVRRAFRFTAQSTTRNIGRLSAPATTASYMYSSDSTWSTNDIVLANFTTPALAPNQSFANQSTMTAYGRASLGGGYIGAIADRSRLLAEADERNNERWSRVNITLGAPDLYLAAPGIPSTTIAAGTSVPVSMTMFNGGDVDAPPSVIGIFLSADGTITTADTLLGVQPHSTIASYQRATRQSNVFVPRCQAPGRYSLGAIADVEETITEVRETNNTTQTLVTCTGFTGNGRWLEFQPRFSTRATSTSFKILRISASTGPRSAQQCVVAPNFANHWYVLVWSGSSTFAFDALSNLSLGIANSAIMPSWISRLDAQGINRSPALNLPVIASFSGTLRTYTHGFFFSPDFQNFVGTSSNAIVTSIQD